MHYILLCLQSLSETGLWLSSREDSSVPTIQLALSHEWDLHKCLQKYASGSNKFLSKILNMGVSENNLLCTSQKLHERHIGRPKSKGMKRHFLSLFRYTIMHNEEGLKCKSSQLFFHTGQLCKVSKLVWYYSFVFSYSIRTNYYYNRKRYSSQDSASVRAVIGLSSMSTQTARDD